MKHRLLPLLLAFVLSLGCLSPALAAEREATGFSDVAPDAWYAQAVELCAQKGIMVGTGEGVFSPEETLTYNQCLTLALRLHKLLQAAPEAPAKSDKAITLTFADGTSLTSYGSGQGQPHPEVEHCEFSSGWWEWGNSGNRFFQLGLVPSGLVPADPSDPEFQAAHAAAMADINAWAEAHEGEATLTVGNMTLTGKLNCWAPYGDVSAELAFHPEFPPDADPADCRAKENAIRDAVYDETNTVPAPPAERDETDSVAFDPAPEDWGKVTLTLADGTALTSYSQNTASLPGLEGAEFRFMWGMWRHTDYGYLCAELEPAPGLMGEDFEAWKAAQQAGQDWGDAHEGAATVQVGGMTVPGTVQCWMPVGNWVLAFHPDDGDDSEGGAAIRDALEASAPVPGTWWRDGAWYLSQHEDLDSQFTFCNVDQPALRRDFAKALYAAAGELPAVRQVDVPDLDADYSSLYDAGILTGTDAYGTFNGEGRLTRAQAAVMVARVLDESQRVTTPLEPLPTEGYTLAYLMDGVPGSGITYPVCALVDWEENQGHSGILLLDGALLPWPEHASVLEPCGDYVFFGVHDETTENLYDSKTGLMDRNGQFIVPMENMRTVNTYAIDGGFFSEVHRPDDTTVWTLLDEEGRLVREVEAGEGDPREVYPPKGRNPYQGIEDRYSTTGDFKGAYYVDANGSPVSQKFDWAGHITDDGQGFVGLDGKIYRINFAQ